MSLPGAQTPRPGSLGTTRNASALALCVALAAAHIIGSDGATPAGAAPVGTNSRQLATEVCQAMVRNSVETALGAPLVAPQQGTWTGHRYTCRYDIGGGTLLFSVDVQPNSARARSAFAAARRAVVEPQRLNGLGDQAFQARNGIFVGRKDRFVLRVDPSGLPAHVDRGTVAYAAARAVFNCWTG